MCDPSQVKVQIFDTYEDFLKALTNNPTEESEPLPDFPINPEDIETVDQLLTIIDFIKANGLHLKNIKYQRLFACKEALAKLKDMIGLTEAKENLAAQLLSLCDRSSNDDSTKINSVIYGPPGCGKTTLAQVLADVYLQLGAVKTSKMVTGDRANLIGQYIGETAIKTKKVLQSAIGGVLFIDEAYQLGHAADGNRCPYAYECINTINQFITENPGKIVIILAGYEKDIQQNFFAQNDGLARRFPFKYTIKDYTEQELFLIFKSQAARAGYTLDPEGLTADLFKDKKLFEFYGGDTENYFNCCRIVHDKRMFSYATANKILTKVDTEKGLTLFKKHKSHKEDTDNGTWRHMYM
jgi:SpoVK/Ycf46/Vps4 family AAA+-type ATPase